jgi:uncharacterized membrane protein YkoI
MTDARFLNKKVVIVAILAGGLFSAMLVGSVAIASAQEEETRAGMPEISGSVNVKEQARNFIIENVKVSFVDAATAAQAHVEGGKVLGGHIGIVQGYLVYTFLITDASSETAYKVIVDVGNGQVLYKSDGYEFGAIMSGHRGFDPGGFGHGKHFGKTWTMNHQGIGLAH